MSDKLDERQKKAIKNAKMAYKLIEKKEDYTRLIEAVETKQSRTDFINLCADLGIEDPEASELWKLIMYESGKTATGVCW